MYKIFLKNSVIEIGHHPSDNETYTSVISPDDFPFNKRLPDYLKQLEISDENIFLQTREPDATLQRFRHELNWIEAGGGAVFRTDGKLLLIKRLGVWDLPKGKLEKHETAEEGAMREVEEECNISGLSITQTLKPGYHLYERHGWNLKKTHWFKMACTVFEEAKPQLEEDIECVEWVELDEALVRELNTYLSIREVLLQL